MRYRGAAGGPGQPMAGRRPGKHRDGIRRGEQPDGGAVGPGQQDRPADAGDGRSGGEIPPVGGEDRPKQGGAAVPGQGGDPGAGDERGPRAGGQVQGVQRAGIGGGGPWPVQQATGRGPAGERAGGDLPAATCRRADPSARSTTIRSVLTSPRFLARLTGSKATSDPSGEIRVLPTGEGSGNRPARPRRPWA